MILKKTSIPSEKENIVNQMQMIRVGEGAFGVGQTERAITPSSEARHQDTCPASSDFGLLSGLGRKKKFQISLCLTAWAISWASTF